MKRQRPPGTAEWPWVLGVMALASLVGIWALRLWHADLSVPFDYSGDANFYAALIKGLVNHGWYQHNPDLAAPMGQVLYDFPDATGDHLQVLVVKVMSLFSKNQALLQNGYFLLSLPLTAGVSFVVMRRLGLAREAALVCAALFALLPYHFERQTGHLFLSMYVGVPLGALLMLRVLAGEEQWRTGAENARRWSKRRVATTVLLCLTLGMTGTYFAAFTVMLVLVAGLLRGFEIRSPRPLWAASLIAFLIGCTLLANNVPSLLYRLQHGPNRVAVARDPSQTERYSLKLSYLLLPAIGHRIPAFADLQQRYDRTAIPPLQESNTATLGVVGDVGFLALLGVLLAAVAAPGRLRRLPVRMRHAAVLALAAFGLATQGGGSSLIAYILTPKLHAWARMSLFIAFFCLLAVGFLLDRVRSPLRFVLFTAVLLIGVLDQTNRRDVPPYSAIKASYSSDQAIVNNIQRTLPRGSSVFQFPILLFPEQGSSTGMQIDYDNLRPYLHSTSLRWSYGAVKGRPDDWQQQLVGQSPQAQLSAIVLSGFTAVLVDRFGYQDTDLATALGTRPAAVSRDGRYAFFDLRAYARNVIGRISPAQLAVQRAALLHPVIVEPDGHFYPQEGSAEARYQWVQRTGNISLGLSHARTVRISGALATPAPAQIKLTYPDGVSETITSSTQGTPFSRSLTLRAANSGLRFSSDTPPVAPADDPRDLHFRLINLHVVGAQ